MTFERPLLDVTNCLLLHFCYSLSNNESGVWLFVYLWRPMLWLALQGAL